MPRSDANAVALSREQRIERLPFTPAHKRLLFSSGVGWALDAMDVGLISYIMAALSVQWELTKGELSLVGSIGFAGMAIGASLGGLLADRFGRTSVFTLTLLVYGIANGAMALAGGLAVLLVLRFIIGLGLGAELPVASTLVSEFSPSRWRGRMVVALEAFWAVGWIAAALVGFLVVPGSDNGWRWALLIGAIPTAYGVIARRLLPESVRFLEARGRYQEAEVSVRYFEDSIARSPKAQRRAAEIAAQADAADAAARAQAAGAAEGTRAATQAGPAPATPDTAQSTSSTAAAQAGPAPATPDTAPGASDNTAAPGALSRLGLLFGEGMGLRTISLWATWFFVNFSYYGAFVWLPTLLVESGHSLAKSFEFTLLISLAQLPGYAVSAVLVEKWGRRPTLATFLVGSAASCLLFSTASSGATIIGFGMLLSFFNLGAWGALYAVSPEVYPTRLRGTGTGVAAGVGRIASIIAPLLVPVLVRWGGGDTWLVFTVFAGAFVLAALAAFGLPEMRGRELEE